MQRFAISVLLAIGLSACDGGPSSPSVSCEVTLTLVPSRFNNLSSPTGTGRGTGTGTTRDEAMQAALAQACGQLNLDSATAAQCRSGADFRVEGGSSGNIRLFSAVERSVSCTTSS